MDKVIFDTNAYIDFIDGKSFEEIDEIVIKLKNKESEKNIEPLMSPVVAMELLAHIIRQDNSDRYNVSLNANKALFLHCGDINQCKVMANVELQLSKIFWQKRLPLKEETSQAILQMSYQFAKNPTEDTFNLLSENLHKVALIIKNGEDGFVNGFTDFIKRIDPDFDGLVAFKNDKKKRK